MTKVWYEFIIKYKQYFLSNNEEWLNNLKQVENYIIKNIKRPSAVDKDVEIKRLGNWLSKQIKNYSKNKDIMKDNTIKKVWVDFITKYKHYFLSYNEIWINSVKQVEQYIIKNSKKPSGADKDVEIKKLGQWINKQQINYSKNQHLMKDSTIKKAWFDFTTKYKQYF